MSKIDLQELLKEYESNLCDRIFRYETSDGYIMEVSFYREQFCHLIGLQHIYDNDRRYLGAKGYNKIVSGNLTVNSLKNHDKKSFETGKERLMYFGEINELMAHGEVIGFDVTKVQPRTRIQADFIIFKNDTAHILHLFLRKENSKSDIYAPVSYVVKSLNDKAAKQYISNQKYKKIVKRSVIKREQP